MLHAELVREDRQANEEDRQDAGHPHECRRGVLRLGLLECGNAVGNGFNSRERRATGGERTQDDEPREAVRAGHDPLVGELRSAEARVNRDTNEPDDDQDKKPEDERVRRDREDRARLTDASEVQQGDDRDERD